MHVTRATLSLILCGLFLHSGAGAAALSVRDFGARGDKQANDTTSIQAAIDACHRQGGGTVYLPPGDYLSGKIRLRSFVTMHLENGATLWASPQKSDYEYADDQAGGGRYRLLVADDAQHVAIVGEGVIRGIGAGDLRRRPDAKEPMPPFRLGMLLFQRCKHVTIRDVTFLESDAWTLHFRRCQQVFIRGVSILNNYFRTNSDGIDPESCRDVFISDCHVIGGDDCICLKTEDGYPCEHVVVSNCTLESIATAIKLGTGSHGDFRDVQVSNCTIRNSTVGVGVYIKDGGTAERISFSNLSIGTVEDLSQIGASMQRSAFPIFVDVEKRTDASPIGAVRDMTFRDIQIRSDNGILLQGMRESPLENVTLQNVTLRVDKGFDYAQRKKHWGGKGNPKDDRISVYARKPSYVTLAYVNGLVVDNVRVLIKDDVFGQYPRSALSIHEAQNGTIRSVWRQPAGISPGEPVLSMHNCRQMLVTGCFALPDTPVFLALAGGQTAGISLAGNDLGQAKDAFLTAAEVPADAVRGDARSLRRVPAESGQR